MAAAGLRARLEHVVWLGGASGSGKSTVSRRLADERGMRLYSTDDAMSGHAARLGIADAPLLAEFKAMSMDQRWCERSPQQMLDTFHWFRGEGFELIVEDLLRLPHEPVVVEGFRLLPGLVDQLAAPGRSVWLLPTPEFRRMAFARRGSLWEIAGKTSDPELALANLLERDRLFTEVLRVEVASFGLRAIDVDIGVSTEDLVARVQHAVA